MSRAVQYILAGLLITSAIGCQQMPPEPEGPTLGYVSGQVPEDREVLFESVISTMYRYYFEPDRQDRLEGIITSHPDTTANFFELWRPQPSDPYYWMEANTRTMSRTARVVLTHRQAEGDYQLDVEIQRYKYNLRERQIDNAAGAMRLYSNSAPTYSGEIEKPSESAYWTLMGRDQFMEEAFLAALIERYHQDKPAAAAPVETQPAQTAGASNAK
jgi:hypothetical protein